MDDQPSNSSAKLWKLFSYPMLLVIPLNILGQEEVWNPNVFRMRTKSFSIFQVYLHSNCYGLQPLRGQFKVSVETEI